MADQRPIVLPHQAVEEMAQGQQSLGWIFEHSHRLTGWFVGVCGIVLAVGAWLVEPRRTVRWLALAALLLIVCQGLLGIFRVALNAWWGPGLAWIHGSFAQLVFAVLVSVGLVTSRSWFTQQGQGDAPHVRRLAFSSVGLVLVQLVLGGVLRHLNQSLFAQLHMVLAFVVFAALLWLIKLTLEHRKVFAWAPWILLVLLSFQIMIGVHVVMNWFGRFYNPALGIFESRAVLWMRSSHYFLGSLILAVTVVIALRAQRALAGSGAASHVTNKSSGYEPEPGRPFRHDVALEGAV